jgi:hypothetical protein
MTVDHFDTPGDDVSPAARRRRKTDPAVLEVRGRLGGYRRKINRGTMAPDDPKVIQAESDLVVANIHAIIMRVSHDEPLTKEQRIALIASLMADD